MGKDCVSGNTYTCLSFHVFVQTEAKMLFLSFTGVAIFIYSSFLKKGKIISF